MKKITNKKTLNKNIWLWKKCRYIWKIEENERIVLYEWVIIKELWDNIECEMIDKYIYNDNIPFNIILAKKNIHLTN